MANAKLNVKLAEEIRRKYNTGEHSQLVLAQEYKVNQGSISSILTHKSYCPRFTDAMGFDLKDFTENQIRVLRAICTKHEQEIMRLKYEVHILKVKLKILPEDAKPNFDYSVDDRGPRYVLKQDTWSREYIETMIELDMEDIEDESNS